MKRTATLGVAVLLVIAAGGCGLRRDRVVAPRVGEAPIRGTVARAGAPIPDELVKLIEDANGATVDSTLTDGSGRFGFAGVPAGHWLVKVSSARPGDFSYVRWFFDSQGPSTSVLVPPLDLSAHGMALAAPADSDTVALPGLPNPLGLAWTAYQAPFSWAAARITDTTGVELWTSAAGTATSADWNGLMTEGPSAGQTAPPGVYLWRVKIHLGNGVQAATRQRSVVLR